MTWKPKEDGMSNMTRLLALSKDEKRLPTALMLAVQAYIAIDVMVDAVIKFYTFIVYAEENK